MKKLFAGLPRTDYQDVLRTVGHYIDTQGFTNIRLIETEDGLILQGMISNPRDPRAFQVETYLLSIEDLQAMLREAYARRGKNS